MPGIRESEWALERCNEGNKESSQFTPKQQSPKDDIQGQCIAIKTGFPKRSYMEKLFKYSNIQIRNKKAYSQMVYLSAPTWSGSSQQKQQQQTVRGLARNETEYLFIHTQQAPCHVTMKMNALNVFLGLFTFSPPWSMPDHHHLITHTLSLQTCKMQS